MNIAKIVEQALMENLIRDARKNPEEAHKLFLEVYADFLKQLEQEPLDFRMVDMQAHLMLNLLPAEAGDKVQKESNRAMAETLRKALEPFTSKPAEFFKH